MKFFPTDPINIKKHGYVRYALIDVDANLVRTGTVPAAAIAKQATPELAVMEVEASVRTATHETQVTAGGIEVVERVEPLIPVKVMQARGVV